MGDPRLRNARVGERFRHLEIAFKDLEDSHVGLWGRRRLDLKPGMTGLWQTLGRSEIPFDEMVRLDYLYITNWSLWNDLKLLFLTVPHVMGRGKGAY